MVKISVSGYDDDEEGPSKPTKKRCRVVEFPTFGNHDQHNSNNGDRESVGSSGNDTVKNVSAIISDPDDLDCFICCEPLTIPIFQCENGHTACSCCCVKIRNKCPLCLMPIGYFRCRFMEKLLESLKISCPNAKFGCEEVVSYGMKGHHLKECKHIPCLCPHTDCDYVASSKELALHFSHRHVGSGIQFTYNKYFSVFLNKDQKTVVLRDEKDVGLFVVHNNVVSLGNAVSISCLGPTSMAGFQYGVLARSQGSTLMLKSSTKMIQGDDTTGDPTIGFLLIPSNYFGSGQFKLDIHSVTLNLCWRLKEAAFKLIVVVDSKLEGSLSQVLEDILIGN